MVYAPHRLDDAHKNLLDSARPEQREVLEAKIRLAHREREEASNTAYFSEVKKAGRAQAIPRGGFHAVFEAAQQASSDAARSILQAGIEAGAADGPIFEFVTNDRHRFVDAFMTSGFGHDAPQRKREVIGFMQWLASDNKRFHDEIIVARENHNIIHQVMAPAPSKIAQMYIDVPWLDSETLQDPALPALLDHLTRSARRSEREALRVYIGDAQRDRLAASRTAVQERLVQSWASQGGEIMGAILEAAEVCSKTIVAACVDAGANDQRTVAFATAEFRAFFSEVGEPWPRLRDAIQKHCQEHEDEVRKEIIRTRAARRKQGGTQLARFHRAFEDHPVGVLAAILVSLATTVFGLVELGKALLK
jgi:hypothetical protein